VLRLFLFGFTPMLEQTQPVGPGYHCTSQQDRNNEQDQTAANPRAPAAKAEPAFEPVEQFIQQKQLKQTGQAALSILHCSSLRKLHRFFSLT
jgi:hypothetical protein